MKHCLSILLLFFIVSLKAQNNQEEYYKNIDGELKPLSEIIEEAQRTIAIHDAEIPYLIYSKEETFLNPDYKKEKGRYYITTEIKKINEKEGSFYRIRTFLYFQGIKDNCPPMLATIDETFTNSLSKSELDKKLFLNNISHKNLVCTLFSTTKKNDCEFEEYWGD